MGHTESQEADHLRRGVPGGREHRNPEPAWPLFRCNLRPIGGLRDGVECRDVGQVCGPGSSANIQEHIRDRTAHGEEKCQRPDAQGNPKQLEEA
jgi:hypothetical protein